MATAFELFDAETANVAAARVLAMRPRDAVGLPAGLSVEVITDTSSFLALEGLWNRLVGEAGIEHPFVRHEWVRTWWECFGGEKRLHILLVRDGGEPIALAPLMLGRGRVCGVPVRRLEFPWNPHTPRFDFVVARRADEAYRALWSHLASERHAWDVLQLPELPCQGRTVQELSRLAAADRFHVGRWPSVESPYVPLTKSWDEYSSGLSPKHRSNLRRRAKRLEGLGPVEMETLAGPEISGSALDEAMQIEAAGWKGRAGTAMLSQPETEAFYKRMAERAASRGWLRLHFLKVAGRRAAFEYVLCYGGRLYVLKVGHDPAYAEFGPQHLLCALTLEEAFRRGFLEYDFLGARDEWKERWTRRFRPHEWLFVFPDRPRMRLVHRLKFHLIPRLQRYPRYREARDFLLRRRSPAARTASSDSAAMPKE